jgi:hypothetical protein
MKRQSNSLATKNGIAAKVEDSLAQEFNKLSVGERDHMQDIFNFIKPRDANLQQSYADEMNCMSLKERETILHDIHGVSDDVEETPEFVTKMLQEMEDYIQMQRHNPSATRAYNLAESQNPQYVQDSTLRWTFLRAAGFDPEAAANRFVAFFEQKEELFGAEKLCKDIALDDLTQDDVEFLGNGAWQLLPTRDRAGRAVIVHLPVFLKYHCHENMVRRICEVEMV